ncbi:MAG: NTP transferase domain-containing protein [Bacteroidales bacterium]|nr:NTP transferase domain-containing protein [Bacteroidales bacterium]
MKAMIFAAGLGTRLAPITDTIPKALVDVGGKPMLQRVIENVKAAGVTKIVVNVHYLAQQIVDYLHDNKNFGVDITISDESDLLLDTGGGLLKAAPLLEGNEPILVHNVDILTDLDFRAMETAHQRSGALATLLVKDRTTSRYLLWDDQMQLRAWINTKTGETIPPGQEINNLLPLAFGGIHIISPALLEHLSAYAIASEKAVECPEGHRGKAIQPFGIIPFYLHEAQKGEAVHGYLYPTPYRWVDVGSHDTLAKARSMF